MFCLKWYLLFFKIFQDRGTFKELLSQQQGNFDFDTFVGSFLTRTVTSGNYIMKRIYYTGTSFETAFSLK